MSGADLILGAVGVLQFEVVTSRLANEYGVEAVFDSASIWSARWVSCDDKKKLAEFEKANAGNLAIDAGGNLAYLAPNRVNLGLTQERYRTSCSTKRANIRSNSKKKSAIKCRPKPKKGFQTAFLPATQTQPVKIKAHRIPLSGIPTA